jgi:hypothetical protein
MTGLRRGELCGLRWADLDLDAATLVVRRTIVTVKGASEFSDVKSAHSRRTIDLDAGTVAVKRSNVKAAEACPARAETVLTSAPATNRWVTWLCRRPCRVRRGSPDESISRCTVPVMVSGCHASPDGFVNTNPVVRHPGPTNSRISFCATWWWRSDGHVLAGQQAAAAAAVAAMVHVGS